ncbi:MAG: CPBP family intramembrane metalloprotease [Chitinophagaceae bacterium]|nr:CPBP family intramembrane metalloprotease [Chitinophagaceae bacterium]
MEKEIVINLIYIAILLPFILLAVNRTQPKWKKNTVLVFSYFFIYKIALLTPSYISWMQTDNLNWNWLGKLLAILFSILFYYKFKQDFEQELYINFNPQNKYLKSNIIILLIISAIAILEGILFYNQQWDTETLLFQATLPGIDEEMAYRGIILGLFSTFMQKKLVFGKVVINSPSIWIVGILFGIIHSLQFDKEWHLAFNLLYFVKTFILGTLWCYMTIKTKSILLPIISHNLSNTLANLIGMIK